jgi:hypothetical protein
MNYENEKPSPEFKKIFPALFRASWMKIFQEAINNLLSTFVAHNFPETPEKDEMDEFKRSVALDVINQLILLTPVMSAIKTFGEPKSLVFINHDGQAIDLLNQKELDENETFNQVLDNLKNLKTNGNPNGK